MKICYLLAFVGLALSILLWDSREFLLVSAVVGWLGYAWASTARASAHRATYTDPLCGVGNRRSLERAVSRCIRSGQTWSALVIDCNGFKRANDEFGHAVGDRILQSLAEHILGTVRTFDHVARTGGDEFVVIMPGCDISGAGGVAYRVSKFLDSGVTVSVGVADSTEGDPVARADARMYASKRSAKPDPV